MHSDAKHSSNDFSFSYPGKLDSQQDGENEGRRGSLVLQGRYSLPRMGLPAVKPREIPPCGDVFREGDSTGPAKRS